MTPPDRFIRLAEQVAAGSPCPKSKRGVVLYHGPSGVYRGCGFNGPPGTLTCPGRAHCGDDCGKLCVHAEMRALRDRGHLPFGSEGPDVELVHVKLGPDGRVIPGGPPSCWQCSREIFDVGFVAGVWLYEADTMDGICVGLWRRYTPLEFHRATLINAGLNVIGVP